MRADVDHADKSVALYADAEELVRLSHQLHAIRTVEVEVELVPVAAQLTSLQLLRLEPGAGDVAIRVAGDTATLSGGPQAREWLARELPLDLGVRACGAQKLGLAAASAARVACSPRSCATTRSPACA